MKSRISVVFFFALVANITKEWHCIVLNLKNDQNKFTITLILFCCISELNRLKWNNWVIFLNQFLYVILRIYVIISRLIVSPMRIFSNIWNEELTRRYDQRISDWTLQTFPSITLISRHNILFIPNMLFKNWQCPYVDTLYFSVF